MISRTDLLQNLPLIIAGPCAVESREQIMFMAREMKRMNVPVLRAQLWKPRMKPDSFQGVGLSGLQWLIDIKRETGLLIATEIVDAAHIEAVKGVVDILWVGARNMQNFELLKALAKDDRVVILKRGLISKVEEWLAAADYIGRDRVILCERGVRTGADAMRFTLDINAALVAKHDHGMPMLIDPSHTAGRRDMVPALALAGIASGVDGLIIETHPEPEKALCDSAQQITPATFEALLPAVREVYETARRVLT